MRTTQRDREQFEQEQINSKPAWTKDSDAKKADKVVRPYDDREIINSGESWKD